MSGWLRRNRAGKSTASSLTWGLLLAGMMVLAGLGLSAAALLQLSVDNTRLAETTPPSTAGPAISDRPAPQVPPADRPAEEVRPTTPAPAPARPDIQSERPGAPPALPPAPAEKKGAPIGK